LPACFLCFPVFHTTFPQKKFWVEVKPSGCAEKQHFMVIHDDGVTATANPESATFPDCCQVVLNWPDASLLHQQPGSIVGVRDPVTNRYQVQLQDPKTITALGCTIVHAEEDKIKWKLVENSSETLNQTYKSYTVDKIGNFRKLPTRPYIETTASQFLSPSTTASGSSLPSPLLASPPYQRSQLKDTFSSEFSKPLNVSRLGAHAFSFT
jgi:hypothetical protein